MLMLSIIGMIVLASVVAVGAYFIVKNVSFKKGGRDE